MRLDKYLSDTGMGRAMAKEAIVRGRVRVDGETVKNAGLHVQADSQVMLDGQPVIAQGPLHLMMHKPEGVVTAQADARFQTVFDLIPEKYRRKGLCAVGRLDRDTTGLLLFTTDGQLAHRLISPRFTVEKTYLARVEGELEERHIRYMAEGVVLSDFTARPAVLEIVEKDLGRLTVTEGKYHQVKRMFGALGCPVLRLHRERVGSVTLDERLTPGQVRPLNGTEVQGLLQITHWEEA